MIVVVVVVDVDDVVVACQDNICRSRTHGLVRYMENMSICIRPISG